MPRLTYDLPPATVLSQVGLVVSRGSSTLVALSVLGMKCRLQMRTHDMVVKAEVRLIFDLSRIDL